LGEFLSPTDQQRRVGLFFREHLFRGPEDRELFPPSDAVPYVGVVFELDRGGDVPEANKAAPWVALEAKAGVCPVDALVDDRPTELQGERPIVLPDVPFAEVVRLEPVGVF
jgi:hypothetical protein